MSNRRRDEQKAKESSARAAWEGVRDHVARMEQGHALLEKVYGEMRRDRVGCPVGLGQVDAFGLHDLDYCEGAGARAHDGAGRSVLSQQIKHGRRDRFRLQQGERLRRQQLFGHPRRRRR